MIFYLFIFYSSMYFYLYKMNIVFVLEIFEKESVGNEAGDWSMY